MTEKQHLLTAKEMAGLLNGRERGREISKEEEAIARDSGLVVAFGYSDDCLELRGAIDDEGCLRGYIINGQFIPRSVFNEDKPVLERYGFQVSNPLEIRAIFAPEELPETSWLIKVDGGCPFDVMRDDDEGGIYCRGAVFSLTQPEALDEEPPDPEPEGYAPNPGEWDQFLAEKGLPADSWSQELEAQFITQPPVEP